MIRTKIIATVGPASHDAQTISALVKAGCDVFRINFSHGSDEEHGLALRNIRQVEQERGTPLGVIADLCGPKIRVGQIAGGSVLLIQDATIAIQPEPVEGTAERISTTLPELVDHVRIGERLLLDDGKIALEVVQVSPGRDLICRVTNGGTLSSGKGVNLPQTQLAMSALTAKDRADVTWIAQRPFDYVALSFVRSPDDVVELRQLLDSCGSAAQVIAKIEKPQALERIESIIDVAEGIMVARGDLGVEMDLPAVPIEPPYTCTVARYCRSAADVPVLRRGGCLSD